ncbi:ABC transporter permease [uncultured Treponema sp.]|uniref:ABC transporter permease n=1 Tax=uncultured Treponema sp. TaxID=162155 RepID=UPI0025F8FF47|nr:ABC transporter permease subunit [uncultured Treponema sp.]
MENKKPGRLANSLTFCLGIILIGLILQLLGKAKGDSLVFPSVIKILRTFFRLLASERTYFLIKTTLFHLFISLFFSTIIAVVIGMAEGLCIFVRNLLKPLMIMLRSIPIIVLVVIIMVLADYSKVPVIAASIVLVPLISEATCEGCRRIDRELIDVYRLNGSFSLQILFKVYIPLMAGYLKQAYVNAVGMGIKIVITTEYLVQTRNSLGKAVYSSTYFNEYEEIYAWALIMILLVLFLSEIPVVVAKCCAPNLKNG